MDTHLCFNTAHGYTRLLQLGTDTHLIFSQAHRYTPQLQHGTQIHTSA